MDEMQKVMKEAKSFLLQKDLIKQISKGCDKDTIAKLKSIYTSLFDALMETNAKLDDKTRLLVIDTFSIWMVRSTKVLSNPSNDNSGYRSAIEEYLFVKNNANVLFDYIVEYWSDGTPALANALRDFLGKLLNLCQLLLECDVYKVQVLKWLDIVLDRPFTTRIQYYLIDTLSGDVDMFHILQRRPDFINASLSEMSKDSVSNMMGKGLASLLTNIYRMKYESNEEHINVWLDLFIKQTLHFLQLEKFKKPVTLYFLIPLFKSVPEKAFIQFLQNETVQGKPELLLAVLKIGQSLAMQEPFHENKLISMSLLEQFIQTDDLKLETFELLTFSTQKSRPIRTYIFDFLRKHLMIFFVDTELEGRNYFISSFKNFIIRLRDSAYALNRNLLKLIKAGKFPEEQEEIDRTLREYRQFLEWLICFLKCELIPGIQYQRASTALQITRVLVESGLDSGIAEQYFYQQERRTYPFQVPLANDSSLFRLLVDNLSSSIPDIRQQSKDLLLMFHSSESSISLFQSLDKGHIDDMIIENMERYQGTDESATLESFLFKISPSETSYLDEHLSKLKAEIAKLSEYPLLIADNNISCYLASLSLILEELNTSIIDESYITQTVQVIWDSVLDIWELVREILCYDSSDSIFPSKYLGENSSEQLITSYAYRSVKEISSVLIVLLNKYPLAGQLLTSIGDFMIDQLFSIRHSGAFQAVLPAFRKCCVRVNHDSPLQLDIWLTLVLKELETKTQHITRRSGGLPFLLTYILSAETTSGRPKLKIAFEKLFELMSSDVKEHQDKLDLPQINAFNCVKVLFIEPSLADHCHPYTATAMEFSFKYFTSDIWALRNCSMMLFTAIQNRVFGKSRKSIGARLFFTRYSGLKEAMLVILKRSTQMNDGVGDQERGFESIFLVLNMLICLSPTPGYGELDAIIDEIHKFLGNPNWRVRDVSARVLTRLTPDMQPIALEKIESVNLNDQNRLHGYLLTILGSLSAKGNNSSSEKSSFCPTLCKSLISKVDMLTKENPCFITSMTYLQIMRTILNDNDSNDLHNFSNFFQTLRLYFLYHSSRAEQDGSKELCLSIALEILLMYGPSEDIFLLCEHGISSAYYEVQDMALRFISEYDLLHLVSSEERDGMCAKLISLLKRTTTLPVTKSLLLDVLQDINGAFTVQDVLEIFDNTNPESTKLKALAGLGKIVPSTDLQRYIEIIENYTTDEATTDSRHSAVTSLAHLSERIKNKRTLLQFHKILSDDDIDIRTDAATSIHRVFFKNIPLSLKISPYSIFKMMDSLYDTIPDGPATSALMTAEIEHFLKKADIFTVKDNSFEGVFQVEKANQYRNDIDQISQYVSIVMKTTEQDILKTITVDYLKTFTTSLEELDGSDCCLGWASSPDVFATIAILRLLVMTVCPENLPQLDSNLKQKNVHPLIFEYQYN